MSSEFGCWTLLDGSIYVHRGRTGSTVVWKKGKKTGKSAGAESGMMEDWNGEKEWFGRCAVLFDSSTIPSFPSSVF
jgi:hypothetical protein